MIKLSYLFIIFLVFFSGCFSNIDKAIIILEKNKSIEPSKLEFEVKNISNVLKVPVENLTEENSSRTLNVFDKWQWQLSGELNFEYVDEVSVYDIDLFDSKISDIEFLHSNNIFVICYFSGGTSEDWRSDFSFFDKSVLGNKLDGWSGERWLDISESDKFGGVMEKRFDLAVKKGCDGVEVDNVDGYFNENGFDLNYDNQLKYNIWLSEQAKSRDLLIGLKNDLEQVNDLVNYFDFAVNEQCFEYNECDLLKPFVDAGKPVFGVEYELSKDEFCEKANKLQFSFLFMTYNLSGERDSCN